MAWDGMAYSMFPCSRSGLKGGYITIVQVLGIHRMQMPHVASSDINPIWIPTCYYGATTEIFFFSNPSLQSLSRCAEKQEDGGGHREQSASGTGNAVATWLYS